MQSRKVEGRSCALKEDVRGSASRSLREVRLILREEGTPPSPPGWKHSPDPDFAAKAVRLRRLYAAAECGRLGGVLVCFGEHGPVTPTPKGGMGWLQRGPLRVRANYRMPHGVAHFFGVYGVGG